jgi:two-component system phosphate regulon sensor histidine kinase PhoR
VVDSESGKIIDTNPEVERLFGYEKSNLLSKDFSSLFSTIKSSDIDDEPIKFYDSVANSQEFISAKGQAIYVDLSVNPVSWLGTDAILVICRDVHERKAVQDEIERRKKELDIILRSIGDGVIALDSSQKIIFCNSKACDFFAVDIGNEIYISDIITHCKNQEQILNDISKNEYFSGLEVEVEYPLPRTLSITGTYFEIKDFSIKGEILAIRDITHEKEIARMKSDFVSNISHELKTPLTSIIGFIGTILHNSTMDSATRENFLNIIHDESIRLLKLIEKVLNISRIEAGKIYYSMKKINIFDVVNNIKNLLLQEAAKKSIILNINIFDNIPSFTADADAISRVIRNLCENAIKYSAVQTNVSLDISKQENQIAIKISDEGRGIPAENLNKIFDKFYRVYNSNTSVPGTGVGLYIVKEIVEYHRGTINVESKLGKGSVFSVFLPVDNGGHNE